MSNITITHAPSGLVHTTVVRSERVTPHMMRVTLGGGELDRFEHRGFDQWFRLAVPVSEESRLDNLPDRFGLAGYLRFVTLPKGTRPVIRNYTVRAFRPESLELDVDFVVHGTEGVAAPWAASVQPGAEVAFIDQGCGWAPVPSDWLLLAADESGLPAVAGILRDLPRDAVGHAFVELFDDADRQLSEAPEGVQVHWLVRPEGAAPGAAVLPAVRELAFPAGSVYAFAVGESALATGVRRHLVSARGVPKGNVTFCGYWKRQKAN
ncbi:siderophore-interacting protein [Herbiconiux sp.]|uniref:siderophore-interacting protein n=1 Tax=Herbiconiux sp. TaxID=1871186 RepID=UPI0025B894BD|nr:siderophore-interacting protein [Herbiconiux sp.]